MNEMRERWLLMVLSFFMMTFVSAKAVCDGGDKTFLRLQMMSLGDSRLEVRIKNDGPLDAYVINYFAPSGTIDFIVKDGKGKVFPYFGPELKLDLTRDDVVRLRNGYFVGLSTDLLDMRVIEDMLGGYRLPKGRYSITAVYRVSSHYRDAFDGVKVWTGRLISNEIIIELK